MMNKRKYILITVCLILFVVLFKSLPFIFYSLGTHNLNKANYKRAEKYLSADLFYDNRNQNFRYSYVKALVNLPANLKTQKKVYLIYSGEPKDSAQALAESKVLEWRNNVLNNIGANYIEQVASEMGIVRWNIEKFPLKIKLVNETKKDLPEYFEEEITKALNQWQNSVSFLSFVYVKHERDANIVIKVSDIPKDICTDSSNCMYTVAFTTPIYQSNNLKKMIITLYTTNPSGYYVSSSELYNTVLHETGHALGIMGHSYNSDDLMHMSYDGNNRYTKHRSTFQYLSSRDINTIKLLYKMLPDITDSQIKNTKGLIYSPIVIGSAKEVLERKLKEAKNYIKKAPDLPGGYIDLGITYISLNKTKEAIKSFKKALQLAKSNSDAYIIAYNLASLYYNTRDYKNAKFYAQYAKKLSNTDEINLLLFEIGARDK